MAVPGAAPCQCLMPGGHQTTSPGRMTCTALPHSCVKPTPAVTINRCPAGCVCQAERAPGSKVTSPPEALMFLSAGQTGSTRTRPVKNSAGPVAEGCSPARVICCAPSACASDVAHANSRAADVQRDCIGFLHVVGMKKLYGAPHWLRRLQN